MTDTTEAVERMERRADWISFDAINNIDWNEFQGRKGEHLRKQVASIEKVLRDIIALIDNANVK